MAEKETVKDLAKWVLALDANSLSDAVVKQTKLLILDSIGCALAALDEHEVIEAITAVDNLGGAPQATIIGLPGKTSVTSAVLANGILVRYLDLNDFLVGEGVDKGVPSIGGHPSDNIAVGLSVGEWQASSGLEVIAAISLGYEIYDRLDKMRDRNQPWDGTSGSGLVASAMAGRLMGLNEMQLAHGLALGAARSTTPGIMRSGKISAAKFLSNPLVAQSGTLAVVLAQGGMTGPLAVLDHEKGISSLYKNADASPLVEPYPEEFAIMRANMKAFPCLATGQAVVAAGIEMNGILGGKMDNIEKIEVHMADNPFIRGQQDDQDRRFPKSREAADHSFYFLSAASILDGKLTPRSFDNERWYDPTVKALMDKTSMHTDKALNDVAPKGYPCAIRVVTSDGSEHRAEVGYAPGYSHGGLKESEVFEKFGRATVGVLGEDEREAVKKTVDRLETLSSIGDLMTVVADKRRPGAGQAS